MIAGFGRGSKVSTTNLSTALERFKESTYLILVRHTGRVDESVDVDTALQLRELGIVKSLTDDVDLAVDQFSLEFLQRFFLALDLRGF